MICSKCGEEHPDEEMELTFRRPDEAARLTQEERTSRVQENSDLCIIDGKRFFIRGVLPLPVSERDSPYNIGLWVEVSQPTFERVYDLWESESQFSEPPFVAALANEIPNSLGSLGLAAKLHLSGPTVRPNVILEASDHPLYIEQAGGIDIHRISEYTALFT